MVLLMLVSVVGAIAVTWVLNRTFLEDYYLYSKMNMLDTVYQSVRNVIEQAEQDAKAALDTEEEDSEGFLVDEFGIVSEQRNEYVVLELSEEQRLVLDVQAIQNDVSILVAQNSNAVFFSSASSPETLFYMLDRIMPRLYPGHKAEYNSYKKIKTVNDTYDLYESYDVRTKTNFIELVWNDADSDMYILIRTINFWHMQESWWRLLYQWECFLPQNPLSVR